MTVEFRPPAAEELADFLLPLMSAFGEVIEPASTERFGQLLDAGRMIAAYDGGTLVGSAASHAFELTVPGGPVPCAGVAVVGVLPTHRRRGILRELMRRQLDDVRERGEPLAALFASESQIYGRFGYGMASMSGRIDIERDRSRFVQPTADVGTLRLVDADEALRLFPGVYDRVRAVTPGFNSRSENWWRLRRVGDPPGEGPALQRVVLEVDGRAEGYAIFRITHESPWPNMVPRGRLDVVEAVATSLPATQQLWRWLLDADLIERIHARLLPLDHPLLLLVQEPNRLGFMLSAALWVRLVDVGAALSARSYRGNGSIVLDVGDGFCPSNEGTWRLGPGGAERTSDVPQLRLDVASLGSVYLGGFTFAQLARAGRVEELAAGALERADDLFRTDRAPWSPEIF